MMNDFEDPAATKNTLVQLEDHGKYSKKEKLIVDSHNVNIVVKR